MHIFYLPSLLAVKHRIIKIILKKPGDKNQNELVRDKIIGIRSTPFEIGPANAFDNWQLFWK